MRDSGLRGGMLLGMRLPVAARLLGFAALVLVAWGLWLGLSPAGNCGSAWSPDRQEALTQEYLAAMSGLPDTFPQDCAAQWGSDGTLGAVLVGLGGVSGIAVVVLYGQQRNQLQPGADVS